MSFFLIESWVCNWKYLVYVWFSKLPKYFLTVCVIFLVLSGGNRKLDTKFLYSILFSFQTVLYSTFLTLSPFHYLRVHTHKFLLDFKKSIKYSPCAPFKEQPRWAIGNGHKNKTSSRTQDETFFINFHFYQRHCHNKPNCHTLMFKTDTNFGIMYCL